MSWSKEWLSVGKVIIDEGANTKSNDWPKQQQTWFEEAAPVVWSTAKPKTEDGQITVDKVYNNKMPTHDPYVNSNSHIYYQCGCGAILDPGTKSFAALNNHASDKGWKVRWNKDGLGYQPFCVDCGKNVD